MMFCCTVMLMYEDDLLLETQNDPELKISTLISDRSLQTERFNVI